MRTFSCIIIEDQIPAQRILESYIKDLPNLELRGTFISPIDAIQLLEKERIDIMFLDIHLPKLSGIDFLKTLTNQPYVILTTAFSKYAIEGFELEVIDYLLKPFSFERFLKAIHKIKRFSQAEQTIIHQQFFFVKSRGIIEKIILNDIQFIEAKGDFVLIHTKEKKYTANSSLQGILQKTGTNFLQCHKSYLINIHKIDNIIGNQIKIKSEKIPIGRTHKENLLKSLDLI